MREPAFVDVEGVNFQILPMPLIEARKWDGKIAMILVPLLGALDAFDEKPAKVAEPAEEIEANDGAPVEPASSKDPSDDVDIKDFSKISMSLQAALSALPDEVMNTMIRGMLSKVTCISCENGPLVLNCDKNIDIAFEGCGPVALYKLVFEVARFNKFTPFVLAGAGGATGGILASLVPGGIRKGLSLARLGG